MTPRGPSPSASSETTQQGQYSCSNNSGQVAWSQVFILPPEQELLLRGEAAWAQGETYDTKYKSRHLRF